jgi:hypothetical protein
VISTNIKVDDFYYMPKYGVYSRYRFKAHLDEEQKREVISMINQQYPNGYPIRDLKNIEQEIDQIVIKTVSENTCGYCTQFGHTVDPDSPAGYPAHCPKLPLNYHELVETLHQKYGLEKWKISSMILKRAGGAGPLPGNHEIIIWNPNDLELAVIRMAVTANHLTDPTRAKAEIKAKL